MPSHTLFLLALKGTCALNCLAALHLAGPRPVPQRLIMDLTGFDDKAVGKGLATLRVLGLVTCTGDKHRTAWQLTPAACRLPLPLEPFLPSRDNVDSDPLIKEEEEELLIDESNTDILSSSSILETPNPQKAESNAGDQLTAPPPAPLGREIIDSPPRTAAGLSPGVLSQAEISAPSPRPIAPSPSSGALLPPHVVGAPSPAQRRPEITEPPRPAALGLSPGVLPQAELTEPPRPTALGLSPDVLPQAELTEPPRPTALGVSPDVLPQAELTEPPRRAAPSLLPDVLFQAGEADPLARLRTERAQRAERAPPAQSVAHARDRADRAGVLRPQFYAAFEAASIYLQFRRPLADALLAAGDGPAWLRHTLGWLCYAERRLPHVKRGAVVYISLRDRLPCDPAYLPPPEMAFEAALAWALRGGEAEPEPVDASDASEASDGSDGDDGDQTSGSNAPGTPGSLRPASSPEDELWQAVITRLARELSPAVIDSQLRPARMLALGAERCLIGAASPQSRDWLRTRLAAVLARALAELTGRPLSVEIVVDT